VSINLLYLASEVASSGCRGPARRTTMAAELRWIRSSYSSNSDACVEFAVDVRSAVLVRDSKDRSGPLLGFSKPAWSALVLMVSSS
jgi:hypothetical protein